MDEGYVEAVDGDRRMIAIRYRDGGSYCVARLLGRHTPQVGQRVQGGLRNKGGSSIADDAGEAAAIFVVKARCSRAEALRLLEQGR